MTVAPSAAMGLRAAAPRAGSTTSAFVAGPGLPGAADEVEQLAADHGGQALVGAAATVDACLELAAAVGVLHVAAHGSLRADNPAFSSLELADGPLTVYDLDQLQAVPDLVVLPACDVARAGRIGDELVGVAHTLLGQGVRAVIAPVLPVPDRATARLMCAVHRRLADGDDPAAALAAAGASLDLDRAADHLAGGGLRLPRLRSGAHRARRQGAGASRRKRRPSGSRTVMTCVPQWVAVQSNTTSTAAASGVVGSAMPR